MYRLEVEKSADPNNPHANVECGRISVVLGSNGAGKTRFLQQLIHRSVTHKKAFLYVEGARVFRDAILSVRVEPNQWQQYGTAEKAEVSYKGVRASELSHRVRFSLLTLRQRSDAQEKDYLYSLKKWDQGGRAGAAADRPETAIETVFRLYKDVFPYLEIVITQNDQLYLRQSGDPREYPLMQASEGERQVFALLADVILNVEPDLLVIVDEPEAHLNPLLANEVWNVIEHHLSHAQFVYATHSISFALRPAVNSLFAIDRQKAEVIPLDSITYLGEREQTALLGTIPAILTAKSALGVEGRDASFDEPFYRWLLGATETKIVPLGGSTDVLGSTQRLNLWRSLAPLCTIVGVIDRDYMSEDAVAKIASDSVVVLQLHEAESYLCLPDLLARIGQILIGASAPKAEALTDEIRDYAKRRLIRTAAHRLFRARMLGGSFSLSAEQLSKIASVDELTQAVLLSAQSHAKELDAQLRMGIIESSIRSEYRRCLLAIQSPNLVEVLTLFPGKELLQQLLRHLGITGADSLARIAMKHLSPDDFEAAAKLRSELRNRLHLSH